MEKTSLEDHKERALATIEAYIAIKENVAGWSEKDLKTTWLIRAKNIGVTGYSAQLKDGFLTKYFSLT